MTTRRQRTHAGTVAVVAMALAWTFRSAASAAERPGDAADTRVQTVKLDGFAGGKRFEGIGVVNGGGATSVLLKDYPEPQRSQILDLVYKPKFGASVSALMVEIPGEGNSTQGSMPSHMHTKEDLDYHRGYTWWVLSEAKKRNPELSIDGTAWSAPGWVGLPGGGFSVQATADCYVKWIQGLRDVYGLELNAIGCRNEKGGSIPFVKLFRTTLDSNGFEEVRIHGFDNWGARKFDFVKELMKDPKAQKALDIIGGHTMYAGKNAHASEEVQAMAEKMGKPIWNTEDHVYREGFECAIGIVECFNDNFIKSGATRIVNWYDIGGVYAMEPFPEKPPMILAHSPWSGHYEVRVSLWGHAHYGQFTEVGWVYLNGGSGELHAGGSYVTLKYPEKDYTIIIETSGAEKAQQVRFQLNDGLSKSALCVWRSNEQEQFVQQAEIQPVNGIFTLDLDPDSIYSLSTTRGQQKGGYDNTPEPASFPFPYYETFESYKEPERWGYLPRYTADIEEVFELVKRPEGNGMCIQQVVPIWPLCWAPSWQSYTILGDENWEDYEVSADIRLNRGDSGGIMGRVYSVGHGYGTWPKGWLLELADGGRCELIELGGKKRSEMPVGDAEIQALVKAMPREKGKGEAVVKSVRLDDIGPDRWYKLKLRFEGADITAFVDGKQVMQAKGSLHRRGMAGLMAGGPKWQKFGEREKSSTPYYDNVMIKAIGAEVPEPTLALPGQSPIYSHRRKTFERENR